MEDRGERNGLFDIGISSKYARKMFMLKENNLSYYVGFQEDIKLCFQRALNARGYTNWIAGETPGISPIPFFYMTGNNVQGAQRIGNIDGVYFHTLELPPNAWWKSNNTIEQATEKFNIFIDNCIATLIEINGLPVSEEGKNIIKEIITSCMKNRNRLLNKNIVQRHVNRRAATQRLLNVTERNRSLNPNVIGVIGNIAYGKDSRITKYKRRSTRKRKSTRKNNR